MYGILPLIEEGLAKINNRGLPISPVIQLLVSLRFYATGSFQVKKKNIQYVNYSYKYVTSNMCRKHMYINNNNDKFKKYFIR